MRARDVASASPNDFGVDFGVADDEHLTIIDFPTFSLLDSEVWEDLVEITSFFAGFSSSLEELSMDSGSSIKLMFNCSGEITQHRSDQSFR